MKAIQAAAGVKATAAAGTPSLSSTKGHAGLRGPSDRFALKYIYNDRAPFEKLPDKYFCPVCGAPKRRLRSYEPAVTKNANDIDVRKARKAELKRDEAIGRALPIAVAVGALALAGLYFYLNNAF